MIMIEDEIDEIDEVEMDVEVIAMEFLPDVQMLARSYMMSFFKDREMHCGGPIQYRHLLSNRNISMTINATLADAIVCAYGAIDSSSEKDPLDEIKFVISILNECSKSGVPKEFSGGMLLLYLQFCVGLSPDWYN